MSNYWLVKSEPDCYSIDDLQRDGSTHWDGVRNYQARNFMQSMKVGDGVLFYHSNADPMGVVGYAKVSREAYADFTAQDPTNDHFDPKSTSANPIWMMVEIAFAGKLKRIVTLKEIKEDPSVNGMVIAQKGSRLSVTPVSEEHFQSVLKMGGL